MIGTLSSGTPETQVTMPYNMWQPVLQNPAAVLGQEALPSPGIQQLIPSGHMISLIPQTLDPLPGLLAVLTCLTTFWPVPSLQLRYVICSSSFSSHCMNHCKYLLLLSSYFDHGTLS